MPGARGLTKQLKHFTGSAIGLNQRVIDQISRDPQGFPRGFDLERDFGVQGPLVPGPGPFIEAAGERVSQIGSSPLSQARLQGLQQLLSGTPTFQLGEQGREQLFRDVVDQPARLALQNDFQGIANRFLPGGQTGAAQAAAARAGGQFATNIASERARLLLGLQQLESQNALQARQAIAPGLQAGLSEELFPITALTGFGQLTRGIQGQQQQEQLQRGILAQPFSDPRIPLAQSFPIFPGLAATSVKGPSSLGGILQTVGGLAGLAGNLF